MTRPEPPHPEASIVLIMGVSGSGKTTLGRLVAGRLGLPFVDADDLHPPSNVRKMSAGEPLTDADREPWLDTVARRIEAAVATGGGRGLVVACSALKRAHRDRLREAASAIVLVHPAGPTDVIRGRLLKRAGHFMPASLLDSQLASLEPPAADEHPIVVDVSPTPGQIAAWIAARVHGRSPGD